MDKNEDARTAYEKALRLDLSYVKAYQYLALIEEEEGDLNNAISLVKKGAKFNPSSQEGTSTLEVITSRDRGVLGEVFA